MADTTKTSSIKISPTKEATLTRWAIVILMTGGGGMFGANLWSGSNMTEGMSELKQEMVELEGRLTETSHRVDSLDRDVNRMSELLMGIRDRLSKIEGMLEERDRRQ